MNRGCGHGRSFDAKIGELQKRMKKHNAPFIVAADETYEQFASNGVKKSFFKFMWGAMRSPLTLLQATLRGYVPLTMSISDYRPSQLIFSSMKRVTLLKPLCKDTADHLPLEKMIAFSNGA